MRTRVLAILIWLLCLGTAHAQTLSLPSTGTVGQSINAVITFSSDGIIAVNAIEWGDGSMTPITNGANGSIRNVSHTYTSAGNFRAKLTCWRPKNSKTNPRQKSLRLQQAQTDPFCPQAFALIVVSQPTPTLELNPNPAEPNQTVTANIGNLTSALIYTLDWGDGSTQNVSARGSTATLTHSYNIPKTYTVRLTSSGSGVPPQIVVLTVQRKNPVLQISSSSIQLGEELSATLTQLYTDVAYTLEWGDGSSETISGVTTATRKKKYSKNGTFTVKLLASGVVPQISVVLVRVPTPTLEVSPDGNKVGAVIAKIGNLFPTVTYTLDWGDGTQDSLSGVSQSSPKHTYPAGAKPVYVVKLTYPGNVVTATVQLVSGCQIQTTPDKPNPNQPVKASVTGLAANTQYQLFWGDGAQETLSSSGTGSASASHSYTESKIYTIQIKLEDKLICVGSVNVGGVVAVAIAQIKVAKLTDKEKDIYLETASAYPDETVYAILDPLTVGESYTLDYGDNRPKLTFVATEKNRKVALSYSTQKLYTLSLTQTGKTTTTTLAVFLPIPATEKIIAKGEIRAEQPATLETTDLLKNQKYELEFGDTSKTALSIAPDATSASATKTYKKAGAVTAKLFWVGAKGTRIQRASLNLTVLEAFTAQIFSTSLYFDAGKNAVTEYDRFPFGAKPTMAAQLTIIYSGFGVLEGDVLTSGIKTGDLKLTLPKNGGEDAGNGRRRLRLAFTSFSFIKIGDYKVVFQPRRLNQGDFNQKSSNNLQIFVYPARFTMGGFEFKVQYATGSLQKMDGKAMVQLVLLGKDFGSRQVEFINLKAQPTIDPDKSDFPNGKTVYVPGLAYISEGKISTSLGKELDLLDKIRLRVSSLTFLPNKTQADGDLKIPYPTCPVLADQQANKPPNKETMPDKKPPEFNAPYPVDKLTDVWTSNQFTNQTFNEAVTENLSLGQLGALGAVNFDTPAFKLGASLHGSSLVRAAQGVNPNKPVSVPSNLPNSVVQGVQALYDYVVPLSDIQFDPDGGFYLENAKASIQGYPNVGNENFILNTFSAPAFDPTDSRFSLGCSGVSMPEETVVTVDLSKFKSPPADALLDSFGGASSKNTPDTGNAWKGILFPKASNKLTFVDTESYSAKADQQGLKIDQPLPANISYHGGYNWSITASDVGAGVVNAWKFDISSFGMSMYHTKIVDGGGEGTFYLPLFVLDTPGRFYIGEVGYNVTPTWEIVTDEFIQKDFGSSSIVAGCGVFAHESGSYPLKFATAYWAVKRLVKNPSSIAYKRPKDWQPLEAGGVRRTKGTLFKNLKQHYANMLNKGGVDKESHCNPLETLKGNTQKDSSLKVSMNGFRVFPSGDVDMAGQKWRSISAPDLEMAGQAFPATQFGIVKTGNEQYYIGFKTDNYRLSPCSNNATDCLPAVTTELRYPIENGKDLGKVTLRGFTLETVVNPETKFKQTFPDKDIPLSGKLYSLENAPGEVWVDYKTSSLGNLAAASLDFCFETGSGMCGGSNSVSGGADNTMDTGGFAVTAQMYIERKNGKTYWAVYAGFLSDSPVVSVLGGVNIYGLYGGIAYNKRWDATGAYTNLANDFAFTKLQDSSGLQVVAGAVFTLADGSTFHGAGVLFIDLNDSFAVTLNVTGWLLTPYSEGYKANSTPHARALIQVSKSGLSAELCVGDTSAPPSAAIKCEGLQPLRLSKIVEVKGYAALSVGSKNYVYVGTYQSPITVTVLPDSSTWKTQATGYFMFGEVDSTLGPPIAAKGGNKGLYVGFGIKRDIRVGDSGSLLFCDWSWYAEAGWAVSADFVLTFDPFLMGAQFSASAYAGAGASGCGVGISIKIEGSISGGIEITSSSAKVNYKFSGSIKTPSPLPDINFGKSGTLDLY